MAPLVGPCENTLLFSVMFLLCQTDTLENMYLCVHDLLEITPILFSKFFLVVHRSNSPLKIIYQF